jgi:hypothetical protein
MINNNMMQGGVSSPEPSSEGWYSSSADGSAGAAPAPPMQAASYDDGMNSMNMAMSFEEDYENELPLLEELGINFDKMLKKTKAVLNPQSVNVPSELLDDADMAGPMVFCLVLGSEMLLTGKVNFGYIYGFSICSALCCYGVLDLLVQDGINVEFWLTCSVLGYCLIPVCVLAGLDIILPMRNVFGLVLAAGTVAWSTYSATKLFDAKLRLTENKQFWLTSYPIGLIYAVFCLITLF